MTIGTLFSASLTLNSSGWSGFTGVERIQASAMTLPSGSIIKSRFRFQASSSGAFTITNAYVNHRASSGDPYDFSSTPTQILFGGVANKTISAGTNEWSDWISFAYNKTDDLLVAFYCSGSDNPKYATGVTGVADYEKVANDASTVNKTGYSTNANLITSLNTIEYETADAGGNFFPFF